MSEIKALPANEMYGRVADAYKALLDAGHSSGLYGAPLPLDVADAVVPLFARKPRRSRTKERTCSVRIEAITDELLDLISVSDRVVKQWRAEMICLDCDWSRNVNFIADKHKGSLYPKPPPERFPEWAGEEVALVMAHAALYDHSVQVVTTASRSSAIVRADR